MAEQHPPAVEPTLAFDRFEVLPRQRLLLEAGRPVRIGSRALDILLALLESPGERVGKAELMARAWPGVHVVEGNLKFQVAALRRLLRDGEDGRRFIEASKGQGYCFVAPVALREQASRPAPALDPARRHNLPEQLLRPVGRDDLVARLAGLLGRRRLVTLVGPGGIGKSAVALAVAERMLEASEEEVWVVDLARVAEPGGVRVAVASAVGLEAGPGLATRDLVAALRDRRMLLVLDNCMHLVDAVAELVAALLRGAPAIRILATSREPLRCEGEQLCRVEPLEFPPEAQEIGAAEALRYPAVQLLVQGAEASLDGFRLTDEEAPVAAEICRKLDGIPLAIELASAWIGVLGLRGLAAQLEDRLRLLTGGRRTALPRHRTMRAALDWSHDQLSPPEQAVFRRLAVFAGAFTLDAATEVAAGEDVPRDEVVRLVLELAAKSLLAAEPDRQVPHFRLLDTTRAYALEKAQEAGEAGALARRHAAWCLGLLEAAPKDDAGGTERDLDHVRAALGWAFAPEGDPALGVRLAASALPAWFAASRLSEAHQWTERALGSLDEAGLRGSRQEMVLQTAFGISQQLVRAGTLEARQALRRALQLAEHLQDTDHRLHVLQTLWIHHMRLGEVRTAMELTRAAVALAEGLPDPAATAMATWMRGIAAHFAGEHRAARGDLEDFLAIAQARPPRRREIGRAGFDAHVVARYVLGHLLWVQGQFDQACVAVRQAEEEARRQGHPVTLCSALAWGSCALAMLAGDLAEARRSAEDVVAHAEKNALADHVSYGRAALEVIALQEAAPHADAAQLRAAVQSWRDSQWHIFLGPGQVAGAAAAGGLADEMSALVEEALQRVQRDGDLWAFPELVRVRGELLLRQHQPDLRQARECFEHALKLAEDHDALAWRLRAAVSLHRLDLGQREATRSREVLSRICAEFREGFGTADLKAARRLLGRQRGLRDGE
jgi:predicted ATPase/DNA-binding winged helix-turn-helix (wHTH) protein